MPLVLADRVRETSTTTGTGTITLAGAVSGYRSFATIGNGNTTYYTIVNGTEWEVGIGTYTAAGTTLSRTTVLSSSNGGSLVNFSAGTKDVFCTYPAGKSIYEDENGLVTVGDETLPVGFDTLSALFSTNTNTGINVVVRKSATSGTPNLALLRSRGTAASPTVVASGDGVGSLLFYGYDGANYDQAASISATIDATPGSNDMPGRLVFGTTADGASGPTERMRIDSAGNIGIGVTPTAGRLHVDTTTTTAVYASGTTYGVHGVASASYGVYGQCTATGGGGVLGYTQNNTQYGILGYANAYSFYGSGTLYNNGQIWLSNTGLGTNAKILVSYAGGGTEYGMVFRPGSVSTTAITFQNSGGTQVGSIGVTSTNTSYNTTSDYRLKENITDIVDAGARVLSLNPVRFTWKEYPSAPAVDGFLAHEVAQVVPEAISGDKDAVDDQGNMVLQSIDQSKLVPLLTAALQEALTKISQLETRIASIETLHQI